MSTNERLSLQLEEKEKALQTAADEVNALTRRVQGLEKDLEKTEERLLLANQKLDKAASAADDSARMRNVLEKKSIEDEKKIVNLEEQLKEARKQAEEADHKFSSCGDTQAYRDGVLDLLTRSPSTSTSTLWESEIDPFTIIPSPNKRRRFSKSEKLHYLRLLDLNNGNCSLTARENKIDRGTLYGWQKRRSILFSRAGDEQEHPDSPQEEEGAAVFTSPVACRTRRGQSVEWNRDGGASGSTEGRISQGEKEKAKESKTEVQD